MAVTVLAVEAVLAILLLRLGAPDPLLVQLRWAQAAVFSVGGVVGWAMTIARPRVLDPRIPVAFSLALAGSALAALTSDYPSVAWGGAWNAFGVSGTALLLWHQAGSPQGRRDLLALVTMLFGAYAVAYLVTVAIEWRDWLQLGMTVDALPLRPGNLGGLAAIPTWLGDALVVLAPVAITVLAGGGRAGQLAAVVAGATGVLALLLTGTRSLWLIVVAASVVAIWIVGGRRGRQLALVGGLAGTLAIAGLIISGFAGQLLRDIDAGRSSAFLSAVRLAAERPITGGGPGTYGIYRLDDGVAVFNHQAFPTAHNLVLNTVAETGFVGLAFDVAALILLTAVGLSVVAGLADRARTYWLAAAMGLGMLLAHAMVDVVVEQPGLLVLGLTVAGIILTDPARPPTVSPPRAKPRFVAAVVLVTALVTALPAAVRAEFALAALGAASRESTSSPAAVRDAMGPATDFAPGWILLVRSLDAAGEQADAITAVRELIRLDGLTQHRITLALLLDRAGEHEAAEAEMRAAVAAAPTDPIVQLNGATFLAARGDSAAAEASLASVLVAEPLLELAADGLPTEVRALLPAARQLATETLVAGNRATEAVMAALAGGDVRLARSLTDRLVGAEAEFGRAAVDAWTGESAGRASVELMASETPRRRGVLQLAWYLAARDCDAAAAARWDRVYTIQFGGPPSVVVALGQSPAIGDAYWPALYPQAVWKVTFPTQPYVPGTWTIHRGGPACPTPGAP